MRGLLPVVLLVGALLAAGSAAAMSDCVGGATPVPGSAYRVCVLYAGTRDQGWTHTEENTPASASVAQQLSYPYVVGAGGGVSQVEYQAVSPYGSSYTSRSTKAEAGAFAPFAGYAGADVWQYEYESSFPGYYHTTGKFTRAHAQVGPAGVNAAEYAYGEGAPCRTDVRAELFALGIALPGMACPVEVPELPDFPAPPL